MTDICMSCCNINPDNYACVTKKRKQEKTSKKRKVKQERRNDDNMKRFSRKSQDF